MTSPMTRHGGANHLVAVFPDHRAAAEARDSLLGLGIDERDVLIGDGDDHVASLRAEMRSEMSEGIATLPVVMTRRGMQGVAGVGAVATVIAVAAAFPLALIDIGGSYWMRFAFIAGFLVFLAWVISFVIGAGMGMNRPQEEMAAERGVTLHAPCTPQARADLERRHPIRLDEVDATGTPVRAVHPGEGEGDGARRGGVRDNLRADDFSPPDQQPNTSD